MIAFSMVGVFAYAREKSTDLSWGKNGSLYDTQYNTSSYYLTLTPNAWGYVSGYGNIHI